MLRRKRTTLYLLLGAVCACASSFLPAKADVTGFAEAFRAVVTTGGSSYLQAANAGKMLPFTALSTEQQHTIITELAKLGGQERIDRLVKPGTDDLYLCLFPGFRITYGEGDSQYSFDIGRDYPRHLTSYSRTAVSQPSASGPEYVLMEDYLSPTDISKLDADQILSTLKKIPDGDHKVMSRQIIEACQPLFDRKWKTHWKDFPFKQTDLKNEMIIKYGDLDENRKNWISSAIAKYYGSRENHNQQRLADALPGAFAFATKAEPKELTEWRNLDPSSTVKLSLTLTLMATRLETPPEDTWRIMQTTLKPALEASGKTITREQVRETYDAYGFILVMY